MVRYLTERLPAMIAPRWILNEVQPIAVRDVLSYLLLALERGEPGVYNVGGEPLSFKAMMEEFARVRGLRRLIVPVPVLAPKLAALWVGLVTPIPNRLAVPLIEGVVHPVVADTSAARGTFPEVEPMPYPEAVRRALRTVEAGGVETSWSGALGGGAYFELAEVEGLIRETRRTWTPASCESVFRVLSSLGGDRGWLFWNWAWRLRGTLDRLVGGPGLRRGRRDPVTLLPGDWIGVGGNLLQCGYAGATANGAGAMSVPLTLPTQKAITAGAAVASGFYVYRVEAPGLSNTGKLVVAK